MGALVLVGGAIPCTAFVVGSSDLGTALLVGSSRSWTALPVGSSGFRTALLVGSVSRDTAVLVCTPIVGSAVLVGRYHRVTDPFVGHAPPERDRSLRGDLTRCFRVRIAERSRFGRTSCESLAPMIPWEIEMQIDPQTDRNGG
jgi:hypothetical protein